MTYILILNAGSATLKAALYRSGNTKTRYRAIAEKIGSTHAFISFDKRIKRFKLQDHSAALKQILAQWDINQEEIAYIGHRVVHGGEQFTIPTLVTKKKWRKITHYNNLAPLHNPVNLQVIRDCFTSIPQAKNIAVFDTALYADLLPEEFLYAVPYEWYTNHHIRKYGFHGISHAYVSRQAADKLHKPFRKLKLISVHLGNGCSVTAFNRGRVIATSMGFTPLDGLVMGTRSGLLDPAVPLLMQRRLEKTAAQMETILNKQSGLLGISGFTSDMREILRAAGEPVADYHGRKTFTQQQRQRARQALTIFTRRIQDYIHMYAGRLGSVNAVIFTGGIGERSLVVRRRVMRGLTLKPRPHQLTVPTDEAGEIVQQIYNSVYYKNSKK